MSMAVDFAGKVFAFTQEKALFSAPCHVLVGVSGGADSIALLHAVSHWPVPDIRVSAVHIHHGLRGVSADRDEQFVRKCCAEAGINLTVFRENVLELAETEGLTVEEAGRRIRYADFEKCRQEIGADYILTAHTSSDQVETVLMRIIRGTGVDGLVGILSAHGVVRRPLLCCSREEVEAYCLDNHLEYVTDETNDDVRFTRNRIRHEIIPMLRQLNPAVNEAILRLSSHAEEDSTYMRSLVDDALSDSAVSSVSELNALAKPVRLRAISRLLFAAGVTSYDQHHIRALEALLSKGYGSVCLSGDVSAVVTANQLLFVATSDNAKISFEPIRILHLPFSFLANKQHYSIGVTTTSPFENVHNLFSNNVLDYDKIQGNLYVRSRREGDTIHPAGRGIGKSLKKLMNELKVPVNERDTLPLLCDDAGVVLIPGYTCDERVRISEATKHFLVWQEHTEQG